MARFNAPPNWPKTPQGWTPPANWKPDPAWGEPPHGWQLWVEDEPKKKSWVGRHKVLTTLGIIVAFIIVIAVATSRGGNGGAVENPPAGTPAQTGTAKTAEKTKTAESPKTAEKTKAESGNPGLKTPVTDGDFQFTVKGIECGKKSVGTADFGKKAQGEYCFVNLSVKNVGNKAGTFFGDNQKVFNAQGQEYAADTEAAIYVDDSKSFLEDINPGNTLTGLIIFDVPKGTSPVKIELHSTLFSKGVTVDLT